jgi:hypothetical protein
LNDFKIDEYTWKEKWQCKNCKAIRFVNPGISIPEFPTCEEQIAMDLIRDVHSE